MKSARKSLHIVPRKAIASIAALFILLICCSTASAQDKVFKVSQYSFAAANVFDYATTQAVDGRELNPVLGQTSARQAAVMSSLAAATLYGTHKLYKSNRKKTAIIILCVGTALHVAAGAYNIGQ